MRQWSLATSVGRVTVRAAYGFDRAAEQWVSPARAAWGLAPHQAMSPAFEDRLCYTAVCTGSYESAAQVAQRWGAAADDSVIHAHVQKAGGRALEAEQRRARRAERPAGREAMAAEAAGRIGKNPYSLMVMMDGWMVRERGPGWGKEGEHPDRVVWKEVKTGIVFRLGELAEVSPGRKAVLEKALAVHTGEPAGFAPLLRAEALRQGLARARAIHVVGDGAPWIWNIRRQYFPRATATLDFYHASQHLWSIAKALFGEGEPAAAAWALPLLHQLKHGREKHVLKTLARLPADNGARSGPARETIQKEVEFFSKRKDLLHYSARAAEGIPIGSGTVESGCAQLQGRCKRTGQFWTHAGRTRLLALEAARRNGDWEGLWHSTM